MSSDNESNNIRSEGETQFVSQSGDEDVLWQVEEITAERGNKYRVKWVGIDPDTGKPWAQSWVPKHDCTNDLVHDWKAKKRLRAGRKRGSKTSTASRTSGASKRAGSSTSGVKTRRSTSNATSSRLDPLKQNVSPPPKPTTTKRKQQSETLAITSSAAVQADEQNELSRPRKKRRTTMVEVLLPPISSDEGDALVMPKPHAKIALKNKVPSKNIDASLDSPDGEDSSPPKAKAKSERRSDAGLKGTAVTSKTSDVRVPKSKTETKVVPQRKVRVTKTVVLSCESEDEDEELRPPRSKTKSMAKHNSPSKQNDDLSEKQAEPAVHSVKVGPPRGVKRREMSKKSGPSSKPGSSRTKHREDDPAVPAEESGHEVLSFGDPQLLRRNTSDNHISPPRHISIPKILPSACPDLSPGAKARLELFDQMMTDLPQSNAAPSPPHVSEHVPDDAYFNDNDTYDAHDAFEPPPLSSPPSKSKPKPSKLSTPNGLIVPETESSGNSQSQSQPFLEPPQPPPPRAPLARDKSSHKPLDLPTIAVIAASAPSSSTSPQDLFPPQKLPPPTNHPSKKPTFKIASNTSFSTANVRSRVADEAPPSSIESFTSPGRPDKGKQRAVEDEQLHISLSEGEGDDEHEKGRTQRKITDSQLKKRGKELFDEAQRVRETEWHKNKKVKRSKTVDEIVNGTFASTSKRTPLPFTNGTDNTLEMRLEDVVDLSGCANSMTLDTPEHSETKPLSEEKRERLRIELRQEEEENTQEAMGIYPPPPAKESKVVNGVDAQMLPPGSPKNSPFGGQIENVSHVEQPTDLNQASVIVQASQEQRHEDADIEPLQTNPPTSSPPRSILENLTDSPRRRLGEVLSLLNLKSEEIQRLQCELADERKNLEKLKVELAELQQSSEPTGPVRAAWEAERAQWAQERAKWENDFSMWEAQRKAMSEEKIYLTARLAELSDAAVRAEEARVKLSKLEAERVAWIKEHDVMLNDMAQRSEDLAEVTKVRGEHDQDRLKWEAESTSWAEEKARLLRSVEELETSVESMRAAKVSAEKDSEFFREQYAQASGFVGSVREENVELEKRVKIAEGQAQDGVAAIKALCEGRVKALQADVDRWKGLTELLQEKDRRTNDELRLRAAQVPELRELCDRLHAENKSLEADVRKLGHAQQRTVLQRNRLFYQILLLKKERASLRSKLSKLIKKADNGTSTRETPLSAPALPIVDDFEDMDPNDVEALPDPTPQSTFDEPSLFPCMWRPQWRDQCQQIFDTKEVRLARRCEFAQWVAYDGI
ncbi:hypothetical protein EV363DRAFT_112573 [Boletus edulis]|nr:hypothetical protein EV363DRAFT_112573 [Boletus edulis]